MTSPTLIPLEKVSTGDRTGGKATALARLVACGERVPPGMVVPYDGFDIDVDALRQWLASVGAATVAVRSSGKDEDGEGKSLAGRHLTELGIPADPGSVLESVARVMASGDEVAVLIQPMLDPVASGVAFSADPVTGDPETMIEAVNGLADGLMAGIESGTRYRGVEPEDDQNPGLLSRVQLEEIDAAVTSIAERFGHHVDVEWAWCQDGLWVLQARPITALPEPPQIEVPPGTWSKDITHSPRPVSPMMASILTRSNDVMADWAERWGMMVADVKTISLGGEIYTQAVPLAGKADGPTPPWWMLGIAARLVPSIRKRLRVAARTQREGLPAENIRRWETEWKPWLRTEMHRLRRVDLKALDDHALERHCNEVLDLTGRASVIHFDLFIPYLLEVHRFVVEAERVLGWDTSRALAALAGSSPASAETTTMLKQIVDSIRSIPGTSNRIKRSTHPLDEARRLDKRIAEAVSGWADEVGHRLTDYDIAAPTYAELPALMNSIFKSALDSDERKVDTGLGDLSGVDPDDRERLETAYQRAKSVFWIREDNVHLTGTIPGAALRRVLLEKGRRQVERGRLDDPADIFFLEWDEANLGYDDLRSIVLRRKANQAWVATHPGPLRHGPEPSPPPDLRGLPDPALRINSAIMWAISQELTVTPESTKDAIEGLPSGPGVYTGPVKLVHTESDLIDLRPGDVMVCPIATTAWAAVFGMIGAIVCDGGGALSHTAIVAREHGIPAVMATGNATTTLNDGDMVTVDGGSGQVERA